jgi:hypothetical protein
MGERRDSGFWLARRSLALALGTEEIDPGQEVAKEVYDPVIVDVVEREYTTPEREVRTCSIAVNDKQGGEVLSRWIPCDDWPGRSELVGTGDRVRLKGYSRSAATRRTASRRASASSSSSRTLKIERPRVRSGAA